MKEKFILGLAWVYTVQNTHMHAGEVRELGDGPDLPLHQSRFLKAEASSSSSETSRQT